MPEHPSAPSKPRALVPTFPCPHPGLCPRELEEEPNQAQGNPEQGWEKEEALGTAPEAPEPKSNQHQRDRGHWDSPESLSPHHRVPRPLPKLNVVVTKRKPNPRDTQTHRIVAQGMGFPLCFPVPCRAEARPQPINQTSGASPKQRPQIKALEQRASEASQPTLDL